MSAVLGRIARRGESILITPFTDEYLVSALEVARETHAASLYRDMPLDETKLVRQLQSATHGADRYFRLAVRDKEVLGGLYGCVQKVFFCDEIMARDLGWWVRASARGGPAAAKLLQDFERWARAHGASRIGLGQTGVQDMDRTLKLFQHCGYLLTGYNVSKRL